MTMERLESKIDALLESHAEVKADIRVIRRDVESHTGRLGRVESLQAECPARLAIISDQNVRHRVRQNWEFKIAVLSAIFAAIATAVTAYAVMKG